MHALIYRSFVHFGAGFYLCVREQDNANLPAGVAPCVYKVMIFYVQYKDLI